MKITIIYPCIFGNVPGLKTSRYYYTGIASLSAYLKQAGHRVSLIYYARQPTKEKFIHTISQESPDIIGFSSTTHMFGYVKKMAYWVKEEFNIPIICGGIHPTIDPENTITQDGIDMICIGEGEEALLELCTKYAKGEDITNILNIWVKKDGKIYKNPPRPLIEDLDSLPFPDRELFEPYDTYLHKYGILKVMLSRGCPYNCTFCCIPKVREIYNKPKKFVRYRSVENSIKYLKKIINRYSNINFIIFSDDVLPLNKNWFREFAKRYKREINKPYCCNSRVEISDEKTVRLLKESGCLQVILGVESGDDFIRNEIYNKHISRAQINSAVKLYQQADIKLSIFYMVGAPFETPRTILNSIKFASTLQPSNGIRPMDFPCIFYPYPGTKLYQICKDFNFLTNKNFDTVLESTIITQPSITTIDIIFTFYTFMLFVRAYYLSNKLPAKIRLLFMNILDNIYYSKRLTKLILILLIKNTYYIIYNILIPSIEVHSLQFFKYFRYKNLKRRKRIV